MLTAVIFDMDGVLIDSEPFWQRAQMAVFSELGHPHTVEDCESTIGVRIDGGQFSSSQARVSARNFSRASAIPGPLNPV